jgi:predicted lipid carrier protein YhbT
LPRFQLPAIVARVGAPLPQWPHATALSLALNAAARAHVLPRDSLAQLEGRTFLIVVSDAGSRAAFTFVNGGFKPLFNFHDNPDITFTATLSVFLRLLAREEDPDTLFFNRELSVEGDTELGLMVKNMLDAVEFPRRA